MSLADQSECCATVIANPTAFINVATECGGISASGHGMYYEDIVAILSDVLERKIRFLPIEDRGHFREMMLHDGFKQGFIDHTLLPQFFDYKQNPGDTILSEWTNVILHRQPENLRDWLTRYGHFFVD